MSVPTEALFVKQALRTLPIAYGWSDVEAVSAYNAKLRQRTNRVIGRGMREITRLTKKDLRHILLDHPDILRHIIEKYKKMPATRYDFDKDPDGEIIWYEAAQRFSRLYPLDLGEYGPLSATNMINVIGHICNHFRGLVEQNGLFQLLYDDNGKQKNERAAQLLFYGIADAYCQANNLDLSRESNAGRGPVDFKLSRGNARVNVEVKYSTNARLRQGYTNQLPTYDKAEKTFHSIFLIIRTNDSTDIIEELHKMRDKEWNSGRRSPDIIVVDGRRKPSASKL